MSNTKFTHQFNTSLEKVLRRFESSIAPYPRKTEEYLEEYAKKRAEHPGLYFLGDLQLHYFSLAFFHDAAQKALATPQDLLRISAFVRASYEQSDDGTLHNLALCVTGETELPLYLDPQSYDQNKNEIIPIELAYEKYLAAEIEKDLRDNAPNISMAQIQKLQAEIKDLEAKRAGILEAAALLSDQDSSDKNFQAQNADLMNRLLRFWSGFKKSFIRFSRSDDFGDLVMAIKEVQRSTPKNGTPRLADLPKRLFYRFKNYSSYTGRRNSKLSITQHESLDKLLELQESSQLPRSDFEALAIYPEDAEKIDLRISIKKLPDQKRQVIDKLLEGKKLGTRERKIKSRTVPILTKELLS